MTGSLPPPRALLLAGGEGLRLRPITASMPKCLVPIRGKPLLGIWLDMLFQAGVERVLVNTHYLAGQVNAFVANSPWADRIDLVHEQALLGTAGTLRANAGYFGNDSFFLIHADNLSRFSVTDFSDAHRRRPPECIGTMMTFATDKPQNCGIVEIDSRGVVAAVHEKVPAPPRNLANAAVFILESAIFPELTRYPLATDFCRDIVPPLTGRWSTFHNAIYHRDIGSPESLDRAQQEYKWI